MNREQKAHNHVSGDLSVEIMNGLDGKMKDDLRKEITQGLHAPQKSIPCKYFYDARGSRLFEDICELPEYYPTRTEISILQEIAPKLMEPFTHSDLVELGSGASEKACILLEAAGSENRATLRYIPVDISESTIRQAARDLLVKYPELEVVGVVDDFTTPMDFHPNGRRKMLCFLGGTIGNLNEVECIAFLQNIAKGMINDDTFLIGFDMVKSRETLERAYNDSQGVTAAFNKNILNVVNNEFKANFSLSCFDHLAFFNDSKNRIEMHLQANRDCSIRLESLGIDVHFKKGETIHTENSRKFTKKCISDICHKAGLSIKEWFTDSNTWFSLVLMEQA